MFNLADLDNEYNDAKAPDREELPDGSYQVTVDRVELGETKNEPKKPMLKWEFKVIAGDHVGRKLFKNSVMMSGQALAFLKADLTAVGYTGPLSGLQDPAVRQKLLDVGLEIKKVTKGHDDQGRPNSNIYINRKIDASSPAMAAVKAATDTPF